MDQISRTETERQVEAGVQEEDNGGLEQGSREGFMKYLDQNQ